MTRHGRNNTASACYTYHERQRDAQKSGYGTIKKRLGKDSIKDFDSCSLTLQPCRNPVVTPDGHLYDKEAILEYILKKKSENIRKMKEYEKQKKKDLLELEELAQAEQKSKEEKFFMQEKSVVINKPKEIASIESVSNMANGRDKSMPSFWVPSLTPSSSKSKDLSPPDQKVYCPMSGKPLRAKDLIDINLVPIDKGLSREELIAREERYICPITGDVLSNSIPCAVLKTSGSVVTMECVDKLIKKDMIDPTNGKKLKEKDIIPLVRGGTGYSSTNDLNATIQNPVMQA